MNIHVHLVIYISELLVKRIVKIKIYFLFLYLSINYGLYKQKKHLDLLRFSSFVHIF